jgi:hypothetical protein
MDTIEVIGKFSSALIVDPESMGYEHCYTQENIAIVRYDYPEMI